MKKVLLRIFTPVAALALVLLFSEGRTNDNQPPPGNSNDPPSNGSCAKSGCHSDNPVQNNSQVIALTIGPDAANQSPLSSFTYVPGTTYTMVFDIVSSSGGSFGFQMIGLDNNNAQAGSFTVTDASNTSLLTLGSSGKSYVGHKNASTTKTWTFNWTAPSSNVGDISFYAIVNVANGNGNRTGDIIHTATLVLSPESSTGLANSNNLPIGLNPNPASGIVNLNFEGKGEGETVVSLTEISGKKVAELYRASSETGQRNIAVELPAGLAHGIYIVGVKDGNRVAHSRIICK